MTRHRLFHTQDGFTIPELLASLIIVAIVTAATMSVLRTTFNSVGYQARITDTQLDEASAVSLVQDDLRAAGYVVDNMNQPIFQSLTTGTTADHVTFVGDVNSDDVSDRVTYAVQNGELMRTQDEWNGVDGWVAGVAQPVAANVTAFTLKFFNVDPCTGSMWQQTAPEVLGGGKTTYISIKMTGTATYKGQSITRTLSSGLAARQGNVLPTCS